MKWKYKLAVLITIALPAFTGFPLTAVTREILFGLSYSWPVYFLFIHTGLIFLLPIGLYGIMVSIAALITLPVVFVGGAVSYLLITLGLSDMAWHAHGSHYVQLCITMLTMIPLALAMVATIPFQRLENHLLRHPGGVTRMEKAAIMCLRVFNHIVFFVIPDILEVIREEKHLRHFADSPGAEKRSFTTRVRGMVELMMQLAMESICGAVQYIPLWAWEIAQLPDRVHRMKKNDAEIR